MEPNPYSSFKPYLASAIILFILGWGGAAIAVLSLTPTVWARWMFFFCGTLGLISVALPAAWFLNLRFPSLPPAGASVIVRQAVWVGLYGALLTWLQQERLVNLGTGIGLAAGLIAIEILIRLREKSRWQPAPAAPAEPAEAVSKESDPPVK